MCANYNSAGVYLKETDASNTVTSVPSSTAAIVGYSPKGSTDTLLMSSARQFITEYGIPDPASSPADSFYFHYSALAFLEQGTQLYCKRVHNGALYGGVTIVDADSADNNYAFVIGKSSSAYFYDSGEDEESLFIITGKDPGVWNNSISIKIQNVKGASDAVVTDRYTFEILVYYTDAEGNTTLVETWKVSRKHQLDGYGSQMYLEDRINGYSKYIRVADSTRTDTILPKVQSSALVFTEGSNGNAVAASDVVTGWTSFANKADVTVRLLINGGQTDLTVHTKMMQIAAARMDCFAILDIPYAQLTNVTTMSTWRTTTAVTLNSSYCGMFTGWGKVYDTYTDRVLELPPSGYVAARFAYNDRVAGEHYAPAGENRGQLSSFIGLTNTFDQESSGDLDALQLVQLNPIQFFRGRGIFIWGQKTMQTKSSALSRINVRRLLIAIENDIANLLKSFLFENNTAAQRERIVAIITEYLDTWKNKGAFQTEAGDNGYYVLCDTRNNTPATIDLNELHVDIFVKPVRCAEYVVVNTVATKSGSAFTELIQQGIYF